MLLITLRPGLGITRLRFNGYNLSLTVRHPFKNTGAKITLNFGKSHRITKRVRHPARPQEWRTALFERLTPNAADSDEKPTVRIFAEKNVYNPEPGKTRDRFPAPTVEKSGIFLGTGQAWGESSPTGKYRTDRRSSGNKIRQAQAAEKEIPAD